MLQGDVFQGFVDGVLHQALDEVSDESRDVADLDLELLGYRVVAGEIQSALDLDIDVQTEDGLQLAGNLAEAIVDAYAHVLEVDVRPLGDVLVGAGGDLALVEGG